MVVHPFLRLSRRLGGVVISEIAVLGWSYNNFLNRLPSDA